MQGKGLLHKKCAADPAIQIDGGATGDQPVIAGIDEVRTDLEGGHGESAPHERRHEPQGDGGLSGTAVRSGDDD